jgi:hypothetical protein
MRSTKKTRRPALDVNRTLSMPEFERLLDAIAQVNAVERAERERLEELEAEDKATSGA